MSHLNKELIKKLTQLSRIDCTPEEQAGLLQSLETILSYVDQLQEVDTEAVKPCNHVLAAINNVMRDDVIGETLPREIFLNNSPAHSGGRIRVPPVIGKASSQEVEEI